jgi:hypothetical protein
MPTVYFVLRWVQGRGEEGGREGGKGSKRFRGSNNRDAANYYTSSISCAYYCCPMEKTDG